MRAYCRVRTTIPHDDIRRFLFLTTIPRDAMPLPRRWSSSGSQEADDAPRVTVYDGGVARAPTAVEERAAIAHMKATARARWSSETGSDPKAIDWWLNPDA